LCQAIEELIPKKGTSVDEIPQIDSHTVISMIELIYKVTQANEKVWEKDLPDIDRQTDL